MGADSIETALRVAEFIGVGLTPAQQNQLLSYRDWLAEEAMEAGGIGPAEGDRLWDRHIADSIAFGLSLRGATDCLDIGTGVGLPGIPLASLFPDVDFTLLDRAGRRCDLARRAVAVLGLTNCVVRQQDIGDATGAFSAIVSRAAIPTNEIMIHVKRLLRPGGVAMLGLSRQGKAPGSVDTLPGLNTTTVRISAEILDRGANLLRIEAT